MPPLVVRACRLLIQAAGPFCFYSLLTLLTPLFRLRLAGSKTFELLICCLLVWVSTNWGGSFNSQCALLLQITDPRSKADRAASNTLWRLRRGGRAQTHE